MTTLDERNKQLALESITRMTNQRRVAQSNVDGLTAEIQGAMAVAASKGATRVEIARAAGVTPERVTQILKPKTDKPPTQEDTTDG